jgi:hypothetical protein
VAAVWGLVAIRLGRRQEERVAGLAPPAPAAPA